MNAYRSILLAALAASVPAAAQGPQSALAPRLSSIAVTARSTRPISPSCVYSSQVRGTLRARPEGAALDTVRDDNLRTTASIACNGRVVARRTEHLVLATSNVAEVNANLEKGLTIAMPGRHCLYSVLTRISHGRLENDRAINVCKASSPLLLNDAPLAHRSLSEAARAGAH